MENLVLIQNINTLGKKYLIVIQENWLLVFDFKHTSIELVEAATVVALWKKMFFEISHILQENTCVEEEIHIFPYGEKDLIPAEALLGFFSL